MEKNTVIAIVLSTIVLIVSFALQGVLFPPAQPTQPTQQTQPAPQQPATPQPAQDFQQPVTPQPEESVYEVDSALAVTFAAADAGPQAVEYITIDTELITVVLTNAGGDIVSWKLKDHFEETGKIENVEMIFSGDNSAQAFSVALGGPDAQPVTSLFNVNRLSAYSVEFYRFFTVPSAAGGTETFRLSKRYDFKPNEYMFELRISLDGGHSMQNFNFSGSAYTLAFGPQIGPAFFKKLDNRSDYRHYLAYTNGKRRNVKLNETVDSRSAWAAIAGKYFALIAIPYLTQYEMFFSETPESGIPSASRLKIVRPAINSPRVEDTYRFYLGPKSQDALAIYNTGSNGFGVRDANLTELSNTRGILAPLERFLKWLLLLFYRIVPNYGVAIILVTLAVKIIFFPLTKKSSEATLRMQALAPKIKELQEKYKDNRQKLNEEMAKFYQKEGYNPISGCLPMLLQFPLFIAMYNLFNNHFDLRGAMFIPGWIPDLSVPESIWDFPGGFALPLLGWTALRGLPFIYVGSQLLYGKFTQMPGQQSQGQMKMMLYLMPIMFFFILYNMPSGLLIYWIFSNVLTLVQQVTINKYMLKKKEQSQPEPEPVIAPQKKKNKIAKK